MQKYQVQQTNGGVRDCGRFFLDFTGEFQPQHLNVRWTEQRRRTHEEIERLIDLAWEHHRDQARRCPRKLFDGSLCRLIDCQTDESNLTLSLGPVTFKEFLGTNLSNAHLRYVHGTDVLADALGVSAAPATDDGYLLLGRRSESVIYNAGRIHPIGGMVAPAADGSLPNPFTALADELAEELDISPALISDFVCLGMVREKHIVQPELIFDVMISAGVSDIRAAAADAADADEHSELIPVRNDPSAIVKFIEDRYQEMSALAVAALLLHGQRSWGTGWFAATRGYLRGVV